MKHHKAAVDPVSLAAQFRDRFGTDPRVFRAPGRVNLIGEHTDYNDGYVMPVALALSCWVAAAPRSDRTIFAHSLNTGESGSFQIDAAPARTGTWLDYVSGVAAMLREHHAAVPANLLIHGSLPQGAGLSSSAALEVSVATALLDLANVSLDRTAVAQLCRRAENEVVGAAVGIMDQYTAVHARDRHALLLDCRDLQHRLIPLPSELRIVACNSMVKHSIAGGEYNKRRAECMAAVQALQKAGQDVRSLRDVDLNVLERTRDCLGDVLFRRARHVVTENLRVMEAAAALESRGLAALGRAMADSHRSLRDDYEVSSRELDILVDAVTGRPGVVGSRMTGGGFGGCTVNLVDEEMLGEFCDEVAARYEAATGIVPEIYVSESADAAVRVDV